MIEILVIWFVSGAFAKRAIAKGRPGWQGRLPIIVGWFSGELIGFFIGLSQGEGGSAELYSSMLLMAFIGLGIGIAIAMVLPARPGAPVVPQMSAAGVPLSPVAAYAPPAPAAPRMAGFCSECGKNVWLDAAGRCENGHSADKISNTYTTT
jgi:predicted lipid-binding transport protein (Tim44 family)